MQVSSFDTAAFDKWSNNLDLLFQDEYDPKADPQAYITDLQKTGLPGEAVLLLAVYIEAIFATDIDEAGVRDLYRRFIEDWAPHLTPERVCMLVRSNILRCNVSLRCKQEDISNSFYKRFYQRRRKTK
jgi:hypothetical protein